MEQNMQVIAKKIWKIVRVAFFMLRRGMSKRKLLFDLNMMKHRSKMAGKAIFGHLIFHHHHHDTADTATVSGGDHLLNPSDGGEYEFSCSSTPLYRHYLPKRKNHRRHVPVTCVEYEHIDGEVNFEALSKALEMMVQNDVVGASPALPGLGFGWSPMPTRQLRITDSPYPVQNSDPVDSRIDQQAEEFIKTFYSQLRQQKS